MFIVQHHDEPLAWFGSSLFNLFSQSRTKKAGKASSLLHHQVMILEVFYVHRLASVNHVRLIPCVHSLCYNANWPNHQLDERTLLPALRKPPSHALYKLYLNRTGTDSTIQWSRRSPWRTTPRRRDTCMGILWTYSSERTSWLLWICGLQCDLCVDLTLYTFPAVKTIAVDASSSAGCTDWIN